MDLFLSSDLSIWSTVAFSFWEILIILLPLFPLTFLQTQKWMPYSFAQLMTILMLIGVVFVITSEMFLGRTSISLVLLLLLNFGIAFKLEFISLIEIIESSLIHLFHGLQLPLLLAQTNHFFCLYQQEKSTYKQKFRQTSNYCKMALEAAKLAYVNEAKESIASQKFGLHDFWQIANSILNKGKSAISLLFNDFEVLSSLSDKAKLFAENFSKNSILDNSGIYWPAFPSRTNLKQHNIPVTSKLVEMVASNLNLSKMSGLDCIPVVVLKNCEPELSFILAELFNICLRESCLKVSFLVPVFKNMGEK